MTGKRKPETSTEPLLTRLADDRNGVIMVMFALLLPVLIIFVSLAVEVGMWYKEKRELQNVADAAAIAAAYDIRSGGDSTSACTAATTSATANNFTAASCSGDFDLNFPGSSFIGSYYGDYSLESYAVEVIVSENVNLLFSQAVGLIISGSDFDTGGDISISASAVTNLGSTATACILSLDDSSSGALSVSGGTTATLSGCAVAANSTDDSAIKLSGGSTMATDCASSAGGISIDGSSTLTTTNCSSATTNGMVIPDPYDSRTEPSDDGSCGGGGPAQSTSSDGDTLNPGTFCNGLTIQHSNVVMESGVYVLYNGDFKVNAGASVTSNGGVTIFLTGSASNQVGTVNFGGTADVDLDAPTVAEASAAGCSDCSGILMWQDDLAPDSMGNNGTLNGGINMDLDGVIYFPNGNINITGGAAGNPGGSCTQMVAQTVSFSSDMKFNNDCDLEANFGASSIEIYDKVVLVE